MPTKGTEPIVRRQSLPRGCNNHTQGFYKQVQDGQVQYDQPPMKRRKGDPGKNTASGSDRKANKPEEGVSAFAQGPNIPAAGITTEFQCNNPQPCFLLPTSIDSEVLFLDPRLMLNPNAEGRRPVSDLPQGRGEGGFLSPSLRSGSNEEGKRSGEVSRIAQNIVTTFNGGNSGSIASERQNHNSADLMERKELGRGTSASKDIPDKEEKTSELETLSSLELLRENRAGKERERAANEGGLTEKEGKSAANAESLAEKEGTTSANEGDLAEKERESTANEGGLTEKEGKSAANAESLAEEERKSAANEGGLAEEERKSTANEGGLAEKKGTTSANEGGGGQTPALSRVSSLDWLRSLNSSKERDFF